VIDQPILTAVLIVCLSIVAFLALRRLLDRRRPATEPAPGSSPEAAQRVDHSFAAMVHATGFPLSVGQTLGLFATVALSMMALFFFWWNELWAAALGLALGLALPLVILMFFQGRRRQQIQAQLPDALSFMARSLRAGVGLEETVARAGAQLEEPVADEFRRSAGQIQLGLHPQLALQNAAARVGLLDFNVLVSTVALYYQSGGNLALLLDRLAAAARDRNQFIGYFRAATALGRTAAIILGAAVPCILLAYVIFPPEHLGTFFFTPAGWQLLAIVAVLEVIGIVWTLYLLRIDY
jgi:tight adherence protein B